MIRQPTVYTIRAINEFGHPIYQQTTCVSMAWRIFKAWRVSQITNAGLRDVRVEPAIPVIEDGESMAPGQVYVEYGVDRTFYVKVSGWSVAATIREKEDHNCSISVFDDCLMTSRSIGSYRVNLRSAFVIAVSILTELAKVDGVNPRPEVVYRENALLEVF